MKNILALLADWANGIFALLLASVITQTEILWWHIPIGLLLSHLPDIDAVPELLRRGRVSASAENLIDHRTFLHFPLFSIPLSFLAALYVGYWGWVLFISIILHLVNDLYGTGWGLRLLYPFSHRYFKVLGRRVNRLKHSLVLEGRWDVLTEDERKLPFLVSWSDTELPAYIQEWGIDEWIGKVYQNPNFISVIEYALFILAVILMSIVLL